MLVQSVSSVLSTFSVELRQNWKVLLFLAAFDYARVRMIKLLLSSNSKIILEEWQICNKFGIGKIY